MREKREEDEEGVAEKESERDERSTEGGARWCSPSPKNLTKIHHDDGAGTDRTTKRTQPQCLTMRGSRRKGSESTEIVGFVDSAKF